MSEFYIGTIYLAEPLLVIIAFTLSGQTGLGQYVYSDEQTFTLTNGLDSHLNISVLAKHRYIEAFGCRNNRSNWNGTVVMALDLLMKAHR